jgi:hypothetical protein
MGLMTLLKVAYEQPANANLANFANPNLKLVENSDKLAGLAALAALALATTTSPKTINISHSDAMAEKRRQKVLMMLATPPLTKRVIINDTDSNSDNVIITVGLHDIGTCELLIPKAQFDPFDLMLMIESLPSDESEVNNKAYLKQSSELTAYELMMLIRRAEISLALCDGELSVTPAIWIDDELADLIRLHKSNLIKILESESGILQ